MWIAWNRSGVVIAILLVAVLMAVAGCAGGKEEGQGVAQDPTESAAASSPVPTEPPPNLINTADAPTLSTSTATTSPDSNFDRHNGRPNHSPHRNERSNSN